MWNQGNQPGFVPIPDLPPQQQQQPTYQQTPYPPAPGALPNFAPPQYPGAYPPSNPYPQQSVPYPGTGTSYPQQPGQYPQQPGAYPVSVPSYPPQQPGQYPSSAPSYPQQSGPYPGSLPSYAQQSGAYPGSAPSYPQNPGSAPSYPQNPGSAPSYPQNSGSAPSYPQQPGTYPTVSAYPELTQTSGGYSASQYPPQLGFPQGAQPQQLPAYQKEPPTGSPAGYPPPVRPDNSYSNQLNYPNLGQVQMASNMQPHQEIPTVRPSNADPLADAQALRKAMKGFGTDEAGIINVLTKRTNAERINIIRAYKQSFGKDLIKDLKSELGGRLEEVVLALMTARDEFVAQVLRKAMAGIGTREKILVDVLCSATNAEIHGINAAYVRLFNTSIENDISGETSGHFRRLLVSMNTGGRFEGTSADPGMAASDANNLLQAGVKKWGTDESAFNAVLATRSWPQLRLTFQEYEKLAGHTIEKAIQSEFSGDVERGMLAIVKCAKNRAQYFAERLHNSMVGFGTKDDDLIFIIVWRSEVDLESIKQEFQRLYNKSLAATVSGDTSGDYKKILLALVG